MPSLLKMSFRIGMMSEMMRWQLEIPLRQVLYISFSLAFLCKKKCNNFHIPMATESIGNTYFFSHPNWILKHTHILWALGNWKVTKVWVGRSSLLTYVRTRARWKYRRLCSNWQTLKRDSPLTIRALTSSLLKFSAMSAISNAEFQSSFNRWHLESNTIAS